MQERQLGEQGRHNRAMEGAALAKGPEGKPATDVQVAAAGFAQRAKNADQILKDLEGKGYDPTSYWRKVRGITRGTMTPEDQAYEQAGKEFVAAMLRKESGGAITPDEWEGYASSYTGQPGDEPTLLSQKGTNRAGIISGLEAQGGKAAGTIAMPQYALPAKPSPGSAVAAPAQNSAEDTKALNWLVNNPTHPQAAAIRERLKQKGLITDAAKP